MAHPRFGRWYYTSRFFTSSLYVCNTVKVTLGPKEAAYARIMQCNRLYSVIGEHVAGRLRLEDQARWSYGLILGARLHINIVR